MHTHDFHRSLVMNEKSHYPREGEKETTAPDQRSQALRRTARVSIKTAELMLAKKKTSSETKTGDRGFYFTDWWRLKKKPGCKANVNIRDSVASTGERSDYFGKLTADVATSVRLI